MPISHQETTRSTEPLDAAAIAFALLARLASRPGVRLDEVPPIQFDVLPDGVAWSFDPGRAGTPLAAEGRPGAPLRIRCTGTLLLRLLLQKGYRLSHGDGFDFQGDLSVLQTLVTALRPKEVFDAGEPR